MSGNKGRFNISQTGHIATVVVVGAAFVATYTAFFAELNSPQGPPFSATALIIATVLGIVYITLLILDIPSGSALTASGSLIGYTLVLVGLMLAIEFLLAGANGIWLISMPLIGAAATDLPPRLRWLVFIAAFIGVAVPSYLFYDSWQAPFFFVLTFTTAFVFVIAFARITRSAEIAQKNAEQLAQQLADANQQLGNYAVQAEELATIQERNRLAREIHDNLGHYLTVVNVQIKAAQAIMDKDPARAGVALEKASQLTQEGLTAVRQSVSSLRESPLGRHTLTEAIQKLANETQNTGIIADLHSYGTARPLDPRVELTLFRAAQEGLTNVRKHSRASRVDLHLDYRMAESVKLEICDNGLGDVARDTPTGFGLLGIEERARQLGGQVQTLTNPTGGYCLKIELPDGTGVNSTDGEI